MCSAVALALGLGVLAGWALNIPLLVSGLPHLVPAHILSALSASLLLAAVAVGYSNGSRLAVRLISVLIALFAALTLSGLAQAIVPHLDSLPSQLDPAEMAPNSLICLLSAALALTLYMWSEEVRFIIFGQLLALITLTVSLLALIGYAYSVEPLYGIGQYRAMSLPGSFMYLLLGASLFFWSPERGLTRILTTRGAAGVLSRRLYLAVLIAPPALGFISVLGATAWNQYDLPFAVALVVVVSILLFSSVIAMTSRRIERSDLFRLRAEEDLRHSRQRLRELSQSMQLMQEEERIRIAREVHDELGQLLTAIKMDMSLLRAGANPGSERKILEIVDLINSTIKTVQRITSELRPSILDNLGLAAAIEWQAKEFESRFGIACTLHIPDEYLPVTSEIATAAFRIFQETLTNVARHAHASSVSVGLVERDNELRLDVTDNGVGLSGDALERPQSFGIMGMRERAQLVGGKLNILSVPKGGTTVHVTIPLPESFDEETLEETTANEQ